MKKTNKTITIILMVWIVIIYSILVSLNIPSGIINGTLLVLFIGLLYFENEAYADRHKIPIKVRKQLSKEAREETIMGFIALVFLGAILMGVYTVFKLIL